MELTSYLKGIADAIRENTKKEDLIPAQDFSKEISALSVRVDTTDADATANDIVKGKTAYVNGEKVEGVVTERGEGTTYTTSGLIETTTAGINATKTITTSSGMLFRPQSNIALRLTNYQLSSALGITKDIIVKGNTVAGIEGIADMTTDENYAIAVAQAKDILGVPTESITYDRYKNGEADLPYEQFYKYKIKSFTLNRTPNEYLLSELADIVRANSYCGGFSYGVKNQGCSALDVYTYFNGKKIWVINVSGAHYTSPEGYYKTLYLYYLNDDIHELDQNGGTPAFNYTVPGWYSTATLTLATDEEIKMIENALIKENNNIVGLSSVRLVDDEEKVKLIGILIDNLATIEWEEIEGGAN